MYGGEELLVGRISIASFVALSVVSWVETECYEAIIVDGMLLLTNLL